MPISLLCALQCMRFNIVFAAHRSWGLIDLFGMGNKFPYGKSYDNSLSVFAANIAELSEIASRYLPLINWQPSLWFVPGV